MSERLTEAQRELARHALGLPNAKRRSYRNRYAVDAGCPEHAAWMAMVEAGYAKRRAAVAWMGGMDAFWLTRAGAGGVLDEGERLCPEDFPSTSPAIDARAPSGEGR